MRSHLCFTAGHELVDDHLGAVGEIAELRFPEDERIRLGKAVAVLEAKNRHFRQHGVDDFVMGLFFRNVLQRRVLALVNLAVQHRVALRERAAFAVLPGKPDRIALLDQCAEGE